MCTSIYSTVRAFLILTAGIMLTAGASRSSGAEPDRVGLIIKTYRSDAERYKSAAATARKRAEQQNGDEKKNTLRVAGFCDMEYAALNLGAIYLEKGIWKLDSEKHKLFSKYQANKPVTLAVIDDNLKPVFVQQGNEKVMKTEKMVGSEFRYKLALDQGMLTFYDDTYKGPKLAKEEAEYVEQLFFGKKVADLTNEEFNASKPKLKAMSVLRLRESLP